MSEATPAVSVVVPARDAERTIGRTLEALTAQDLDRPFEVIVVDNGSSDGTAEIAERVGPPVQVVRRPRGQPAGAARNAGVGIARAPAVAFTDADCEPQPGWLRAGLAALDKGAGLIQGAVMPDPDATAGAFDRTLWVVSESGLYETANLFVRHDAFDRVGGFEDPIVDDLSAPFGEDTWFAWRVRRTGARSGFCREALVHHAVFPRKAAGYIAERRRLALFPDLVAQVSELRRTLLFARVFLSVRTAALDVALLAVVATPLVSPLALLLAGPYAVLLGRRASRYGRFAPRVAVVDLVADLRGAAALLTGTVRSRSAVL